MRRIRLDRQVSRCAVAAVLTLSVSDAFGGFSFDAPTTDILNATFRADFAELTAAREILGTPVNTAMLIDPRSGGLGMLDITQDLFGPVAGPLTIGLNPMQTGVFEVEIDSAFFPALATGNVGLWALFTDTDDGWFGIDFLSLLIETETETFEVFFQGKENDGFMIDPNPPADGAALSAPFRTLRPFGSSGTGFDEAVSSKSIHVVPAPGVGVVLAMGGLGMMRRRRRLGLARNGMIAALAASTIVCGADAGQTLELDDEQIVRRSTTIAYGMVERVESFWNADGSQIWTTAEVRVVEYWKGWSPDDLIEITYIGGTVGDLTYYIGDQPRLAVNEEVVVHLEAGLQSPLPFTGMRQGKLTVEIDPINGERIIRESGQPLNDRRARSLEFAAQHRAEMEPERQAMELRTGRPVIDLDALHIGGGTPGGSAPAENDGEGER
jgi:hypothetical protein